MTLRVGIDVDGVLADFRSAFRDAAGPLAEEIRDVAAIAGSLGEAEMKRVWKDVSTRPNWWIGLQPFEPDQIRRLYALARHWRWETFFLTKRPRTAGDSVQFQTQWWLEHYGFFLPAVLTVPGSRGEIANALRLDIVVDDDAVNCVEVISASPAKALLMMRNPTGLGRDEAMNRGIGVVETLEEALNVLERLHEVIPARRGKLLRLVDWFPGARRDAARLPLNPRKSHPLPEPSKKRDKAV